MTSINQYLINLQKADLSLGDRIDLVEQLSKKIDHLLWTTIIASWALITVFYMVTGSLKWTVF